MSASPSDFVKVMEENKELARRNRDLVMENNRLLAALDRLRDKQVKSDPAEEE